MKIMDIGSDLWCGFCGNGEQKILATATATARGSSENGELAGVDQSSAIG